MKRDGEHDSKTNLTHLINSVREVSLLRGTDVFF